MITEYRRVAVARRDRHGTANTYRVDRTGNKWDRRDARPPGDRSGS